MQQTTIDCSFPLVSRHAELPRDHGYVLYSALVSILGPQVHGAPWFGVHPLSGEQSKDLLRLHHRTALRLRIPADRVPLVLPLAGHCLNVCGWRLSLGPPTVHPLAPSASLDARLVYVKLTTLPYAADGNLDKDVMQEACAESLRRQLTALGICAELAVTGRRALSVKGRQLLGHSVRVSNLAAADSLKLQGAGLGGKRAMGCGIFRPTRAR